MAKRPLLPMSVRRAGSPRRLWSNGEKAIVAPEARVHDARGVVMHSNQLTVPLETVRELVVEQFPEWVAPRAAHRAPGIGFRVSAHEQAAVPLEHLATA
jgi:hypothetical protein